MEHVWIFARSVTYAQRMERALSRAGITAHIYRAPRELSDWGCAYVVEVGRENLPAALTIIYRAGLGPVRVYSKQQNGYFELPLR